MAESKSKRDLTQIINKNKIDELKSKINRLEEELKHKEILLIQLEKLSSLGQYMREIIHELKNPLSAISGFTELGKIAKTKKDREEYLNKIPKFINQITSRLSQFRAMTFNSGINYNKIDLIQVLAECLSTLELLKPKGTAIQSNFNSANLNILGDSEQWIQVFLGIGKSYFHYMKEIKSDLIVNAEVLTANKIKSKNSVVEISLLPLTEWKKNLASNKLWVNIEFENNKIMVPKDQILNAIESSNKLPNLEQLQDLGLVIAADIIKRHQGNIFVKKVKSKGFALQICIPQVD